MLGLSIILNPDTRQYGSVVMNGFKGFKALIHNAQDFPEVGAKGFAIGSGKEVLVGIGAQYTTASEGVEAMSFERRKCYKGFEKEEKPNGMVMEVFSNYDQKSCLMECNARKIRDECECLPFYFPDFEQAWHMDTACNLTGKMNYKNSDSPHLQEIVPILPVLRPYFPQLLPNLTKFLPFLTKLLPYVPKIILFQGLLFKYIRIWRL